LRDMGGGFRVLVRASVHDFHDGLHGFDRSCGLRVDLAADLFESLYPGGQRCCKSFPYVLNRRALQRVALGAIM
jgi:hypothetical protein